MIYWQVVCTLMVTYALKIFFSLKNLNEQVKLDLNQERGNLLFSLLIFK